MYFRWLHRKLNYWHALVIYICKNIACKFYVMIWSLFYFLLQHMDSFGESNTHTASWCVLATWRGGSNLVLFVVVGTGGVYEFFAIKVCQFKLWNQEFIHTDLVMQRKSVLTDDVVVFWFAASIGTFDCCIFKQCFKVDCVLPYTCKICVPCVLLKQESVSCVK